MKRKHTEMEIVRHHGDPVQSDRINVADHKSLMEQRGTAMHQDTWPGDGSQGKLPNIGQASNPLDNVLIDKEDQS
jgi:hypothetical protein